MGKSLRNVLKSALFLLLVAFGGLTIGLSDWWLGSLNFEIQLREKPEFYVGEPVIAEFVWRNESRLRLGVEHWSILRSPFGYYEGVEAEADLQVRLVNEDGQEVAAHVRPVDRLFASQAPLLPGTENSRFVSLEQGFDLSQPGSYDLRVDFEPLEAGVGFRFFRTWLAKRFRSSAEVQFQILPWKDGSLAQAQERALAGDPGGARLLGLYGTEASVVPLLECLGAEKNRELRYEAAHALGRIATPAAIRGLGEFMANESDPLLKSVMANTLMDIDSPECFPWLKLVLSDTVVVIDSTYRDGRRYRFYTLRAEAWTYLRSRGVEVDTVWEVPLAGR